MQNFVFWAESIARINHCQLDQNVKLPKDMNITAINKNSAHWTLNTVGSAVGCRNRRCRCRGQAVTQRIHIPETRIHFAQQIVTNKMHGKTRRVLGFAVHKSQKCIGRMRAPKAKNQQTESHRLQIYCAHNTFSGVAVRSGLVFISYIRLQIHSAVKMFHFFSSFFIFHVRAWRWKFESQPVYKYFDYISSRLIWDNFNSLNLTIQHKNMDIPFIIYHIIANFASQISRLIDYFFSNEISV